VALHRKDYIAQLGVPETAFEFLQPILTTLIAGMWGVVGACRRSRVEVGKDGMLHLSALAAMQRPGAGAHPGCHLPQHRQRAVP
jgi:hypothetical protein